MELKTKGFTTMTQDEMETTEGGLKALGTIVMGIHNIFAYIFGGLFGGSLGGSGGSNGSGNNNNNNNNNCGGSSTGCSNGYHGSDCNY